MGEEGEIYYVYGWHPLLPTLAHPELEALAEDLSARALQGN